MSTRIFAMMDVGKRSLMNSQTGLQTVSHNIANKDTEGYSRQRVEIQTNPPVGSARTRIGMGARPGIVKRITNQYLEKQIENQQGNMGLARGRAEVLARVEQVYNEQVNKGLNKYMADFFNSFRELANQPESKAARTAVAEVAQNLTRDFQRVQTQLKEIQKDVDFKIVAHVEEINAMSKEIAELNDKIITIEVNGAPANDERDRRETLIKNLGEKVNIRWAEGESGAVTITAGNNAIIVSGGSHRDLEARATEGRDGKREGNFDVFYKPQENSNEINVTRQISGGELGGILEIRDQVINGLRERTDDMAYTLATEVNKAHVVGFDRYGQKGQKFFELPMGREHAAETIELNQKIAADTGMIAAGATPNAPADNRIANIISGIQSKKVLDDGTNTLDSHYNALVGEVGIQTKRANMTNQSEQDIMRQLNKIRQSVSGVNLDEETTKMIEFQKTFDASARIIRAADEMMDTVLNLKRY